MAQTQPDRLGYTANDRRYDRGRDRVAVAFLSGQSFRSYGAAFTDGQMAFSYGYHYVSAFRKNEPDRPDWYGPDRFPYMVNETRVSVTTSGHVGAIRRALESAGWEPTAETETGPNGHTYRVWRLSR